MYYKHTDKKSGDLLQLTDWNTASEEIVRLEQEKVDRKGDTMTGDLTVKSLTLSDIGENQGALSHKDKANENDYALMQTSAGETRVNAASAASLHLRQGNVDKVVVANDVTVGTTESPANLTVNGDMHVAGKLSFKDITLEGDVLIPGTVYSDADVKAAGNISGQNLNIAGHVNGHTIHAAGDLNAGGNLNVTGTINGKMQWGAQGLTDWRNDVLGVMDYALPEGYVMVGLYSVHYDHHDDRRFKVYYRTLGTV